MRRRPSAPYVASSLTRSGCSPAQNSASASPNASARSTLAWLSSSTRKRGSTPAAAGYARSNRWQKPWIVEIHAPSSSRARSARPDWISRARMRERSSPAARSVNVTTRMEPTSTPLSHGPHEALDDDRRLAGARARGDEDGPGGVDGDGLLGVRGLGLCDRAHGRLTRQIGPSSHHDGHAPPFGSCTTSPSRMRPTKPRARSAAWSTRAQNSSSSR